MMLDICLNIEEKNLIDILLSWEGESQILIMHTPSNPACTECSGNIKSTGMGVDVQYFASKMKPRDFFTFQSFGINFFQIDATFGNEGFGQGHFSSDFDGHFFEFIHKLSLLSWG